jgi:hypothetical protein
VIFSESIKTSHHVAISNYSSGLLNEMGITVQLSEQLRIDRERKLAES